MWCPGHTDILGNERSDELAKEATALQWNAPIGTTRAYALRRAKMSMGKAWANQWKKSPKTGSTGHAYTGEFRRRFFPDTEVDCPCGEPFQTREHLLCTCPTYAEHRIHLQKISRDVFLPTNLGTDVKLDALATFLRQSGAFTMLGRPIEKRDAPLFTDEANVDESDDDDF